MSTDTTRSSFLRDDRKTVTQLLSAAERDTDAVSVFMAGCTAADTEVAIFVVKGPEQIAYLRSLCERQGLLTDKAVTAPSNVQPKPNGEAEAAPQAEQQAELMHKLDESRQRQDSMRIGLELIALREAPDAAACAVDALVSSGMWDPDEAQDARAALAAQQAEREPLSQAGQDVLAERQRQISVEGWTPEHDDEHRFGEMAFAASCYVCADEGEAPPAVWPWDWKWWKPKSRRRNLVKAGALILAELERLDRAHGIGHHVPVHPTGGANG